MASAFNLKENLAFYGAYHNHPLNQLVHFVFVPLIMWTVAVWLSYTPAIFKYNLVPVLSFLPPGIGQLAKYLVFNGSFVLFAVYTLYYILLDPFAGLTWSLAMAVPMWGSANAFVQGVAGAWKWAIGLHVLSWIVQIQLGHNMVEKRKPALMDSFFQSLFLAPLFVWFELLFLLGYRKDLYDEVQDQVKRDIEDWKQKTRPLLTKHDE